MKLLSKQEITQQKGTEHKRDIDEGLKLARKIDNLREVSSKEEQNLKKFRDESLSSTKKEIDTLIEEKATLTKDVDFLREQRKKLIEIPLNLAWKDIDKQNETIKSIKAVLEDRTIYLKQKEDLITEQEKNIHLNKEEAEEERQLAQKDRLEAKKLKLEAQQINKSANESKDKELSNLSLKVQELMKREGEVAVREKNALMKESQFVEREKELNNREKLINDKYETLLRTIKRIND